MKNFKQFITEKLGKFVNADYKIIKTDSKDNPILLITDFKIITSENSKIKIKAKGYEKIKIDDFSNKKGWVEFDDFESDKDRIVWSKYFKNGSKRIKVII